MSANAKARNVEDRGFAAMSGEGRAPQDESGTVASTTLNVMLILLGAAVIVPVGVVGYMIYKANTEPDDVTPEDGQRAFDALASGDEAGAVVETLAVAKNRKTMKTPLGFRVPNLARFMLPEAEQTRAMGSMLSGGSSKGIVR